MTTETYDLAVVRQACAVGVETGTIHLGMFDVWPALASERLADMVLLIEDDYDFSNTITDGYIEDEEPIIDLTAEPRTETMGGPSAVDEDHDNLVPMAADRVARAGGLVLVVPADALDGRGIALVSRDALDQRRATT